jgi:AcrR family transcriptional regulator
MPKVVDKRQRVDDAIEATWRLVVTGGLGAVTLRAVAAQLGYANGALKPYFATKQELLEAAYLRAFEATATRAAAKTAGRRGLEALRALCLEIMPLDRERDRKSVV